MKEIKYYERLDDVIEHVRKGAFLTVKDRNGELNTMTIGWLMVGYVWRAPMLMVAVRPSRHTFKLIENAEDYTVTIPFSDMKKQLAFCGTHSGADFDKFKECGLIAKPAQKVNSPIIEAESARYYECKIVQATAMDKNRLDPQYDKDSYPDKSYHTYYFGEIVTSYENPLR
jgi:flavin reductase (DIM6/NTAB) family NADH-FMN oxidoreductase RutF